MFQVRAFQTKGYEMPKGFHRTIEERLDDLETQRVELVALQEAAKVYEPLFAEINDRTVKAELEVSGMFVSLSDSQIRKFVTTAWKNGYSVEIQDWPGDFHSEDWCTIRPSRHNGEDVSTD